VAIIVGQKMKSAGKKVAHPTDAPFEQNEVDLELMLYTTIKVQDRKRTYLGIVIYVIFLLLVINYFLFSTFIITGKPKLTINSKVTNIGSTIL
jgi:hypothetical protein